MCVREYGSVLQCVAVCCPVLQSVAVCCSEMKWICMIWVTCDLWCVCLRVSAYVSLSLCAYEYGVATMSRLLKIIGLFCKRALYKRLYSAKEIHHFKGPTHRSHPILSSSTLLCALGVPRAAHGYLVQSLCCVHLKAARKMLCTSFVVGRQVSHYCI